MTDPNIWVSNGTCYFAEGQKADDSFLACGNAYFGNTWCCRAGDNCLANNACYDGQYGLTYLAGCTDPDYADESCPDKLQYDDQPWAGLVYCNGTSHEWNVCEQANKDKTLTKADDCYCPEPTSERKIAFTAGSKLVNIAYNPTTSGGSMGYFPGHVPTDTRAPDTPSSTSTTPSSTPTPPPADTSTSSTITTGPSTQTPGTATQLTQTTSAAPAGLSTGAKAGIGVGVGVAALAIIGGVVAFCVFRRRKQNAATELSDEDDRELAPGVEPKQTPIAEMPAESKPPSELGASPASPHSARSELDDTTSPISTAPEEEVQKTRAMTPIAELPG